MDSLLENIAASARTEGLWEPGDTVVVAVSGGPDSMALLDMLWRLRERDQLALIAAHVNHGFRPEESEREAATVQQLCLQLDIRYEAAFIDMPAYLAETGKNAQLAAREKRYAFLHEVASRYGAARIALAHHADDQAETVLMRILRGTGTGGLAAIHPRRVHNNVELIRPLLRIRKADLLAYCARKQLPYCVDSSNNKRDYLRNQLRLDVLPMLEQYNAQLVPSLVRLAEISGAEDGWMAAEAQRAFARYVDCGTSFATLEVSALQGLHVALQRRLIKLILTYISSKQEIASFEQVEAIRQAAGEHASTTWAIDVGGGIRFSREYGTLRFEQAAATAAAGTYAYEIEQGMQQVYVAEAGISFELAILPGGRPQRGALGKQEAFFDLESVAFPLTVRNRRPGDRLAVIGLNGSRKVQDIFVDAKIPPSQRERLPIVCDANGALLWIPGIRRSRIALVGDEAAPVLCIRAKVENEQQRS